jgi:F-type H+-transporting ATPase subunit delta
MTLRDLSTARAYARAGFRACATARERADLLTDLAAVADGKIRPTPPTPATLKAMNALGGPARRALQAREGWRERVSAIALRLLEALASRDDLRLLGAVRAHCETLLRHAEGRLRVTAAFAAEPEPDTVARLRQRLIPAGTPFDFNVCVQPALLGGFTVRIDDRLVDASLSGRLVRLRTALAHTPANPTGFMP